MMTKNVIVRLHKIKNTYMIEDQTVESTHYIRAKENPE